MVASKPAYRANVWIMDTVFLTTSFHLASTDAVTICGMTLEMLPIPSKTRIVSTASLVLFMVRNAFRFLIRVAVRHIII